ncbi:MAG TPA: DUF4328 domain-containing protein [Polyangia bacterium]|jgi:hypothetical protein
MKYRSLAPLGTAVVALAAVILAAGLFQVVTVYLWNFSLRDHAAGMGLARADALRMLVMRPIVYVAMASTLVFVFLATRNLAVIGPARPTFAPGMAVVWFFIPIANVLMIHQVMTALWRESQPTPSKKVGVAPDFSVPLVTAWWATLAGGVFFSLVINNVRLMEPWAFVARNFTQVAINLAAGVCFIAIVRGIVRRQREQWIDLERRGAVPQPTADALR